MSFFGFDSSRHNTSAPGFSQAHDPFAGLTNNADGDDALDFEDTYDGLGDQLDETDDALNDDTFGDSGPTTGRVGKDFDFFGQTAKVADAIEEEHLRYNMQKPAAHAAPAIPSSSSASYYPIQPAKKPVRTGYEKYKEPEALSDLHVDQSIWGIAPSKPSPKPAAQASEQHASGSGAPSRKVMSLEEVEAAMRAQSKKPAQPQQPPEPAQTVQTQQHPAAQAATQAAGPEGDFLYAKLQQSAQSQSFPGPHPPAAASHAAQTHSGHGHSVQILQRPQSFTAKQHPQHPQHPQHMQHPHHQATMRSGPSPHQPQPVQAPVAHQPMQILQNPNRLSGDASRMGVPAHPTHRPQGSNHRVPQMAAPQLPAHFSEEDKAAYLEQETKRAKRNHKIWLLSRDNGLMTPQDKNFITRIQLQQLVASTGVPIEHGDDNSMADDFYYQVHSSIRSNQRQNPSQPLNNFAQTYLYQTGSRQWGGRRHGRAAENHVQRMEQQVQRAVEAAKNKPKNPQLVIAGSLGKISFSNAKTPKPLLNIRRTESGSETQRPKSAGKGAAKPQNRDVLDQKAVLRNIEKVYGTLMKLEDHARSMPASVENPDDEPHGDNHDEWLATTEALNRELWQNLKVHEPIGATSLHPFIAFLSFNKGKKAIPRVFRHITFQQRATILTMIVFHLDQLDVVRDAQVNSSEMGLNAAMREKIELFSVVVMPSLFQFFNETDLNIVEGVLDLINKLNIDHIAKTRIGTSILTLILSRAELLKQAGGGTPQQWSKWEATFNTLFNAIEPTLPHVFPGSITSGEDIYVWQLLAAIGVSSSPEQQQRLVLAVKDRVMGTVQHAKALPQSMGASRLSNVNLFMQSIGLDVDLLG